MKSEIYTVFLFKLNYLSEHSQRLILISNKIACNKKYYLLGVSIFSTVKLSFTVQGTRDPERSVVTVSE